MNSEPVGSVAAGLRSVLARIAAPDDGARLLLIPAAVRQEVIDHLRGCLPCEGVGLLAARKTQTSVIANRFYPGRNADSSPLRYTMDPADVLCALHDMERKSVHIGAIVHSHPYTPPVPSATDLAEATVPGVLSLIVGFTPVVDLRAWRFIVRDDGIVVGSEEIRVGGLASRDTIWTEDEAAIAKP